MSELEIQLKNLVGQTVSVWAGKGPRIRFKTAISVNGTLEQHHVTDQFRIVVNDGTYTYFDLADVTEVIVHPVKFGDGAKAVISIKIG